jgi:hypothetical protein
MRSTFRAVNVPQNIAAVLIAAAIFSAPALAATVIPFLDEPARPVITAVR